MPTLTAATPDRIGLLGNFFLGHQLFHRERQRDERAGDGGGARAAVGLQHVAVHADRPRADFFQINRRADGAADEPLDNRPAPLALSLAEDPSFPELLARVERAISAGADPTDGPEGASTGEDRLDAVVSIAGEPTAGPGTALWLIAEEGPDGLQLTLRGHADERVTTGLLGHMQTLLEGPTDDPGRPVSALEILTAGELEQLLETFNDTTAPYPNGVLHELFAAQARATPERTAVSSGGLALSFAELDARANQLAHHLIGLGVGPETLVGIAVQRSAMMLVGLLGILKAGGAYVPVDPAYPAERQEFMLTNSQAGAGKPTSTSGCAPGRRPAWPGISWPGPRPAATAGS